jgi:hypothetical protein
LKSRTASAPTLADVAQLAAATALTAVLAFGGVPSAHAQIEVAGRVKTVSGEAWITSAGGQGARVALGTPIARGDSIETGADGSVGITFRDETRLSIGPGSQVAIDEYLFAPEDGQLSFAARIARGTLLYVSGAIARLAPERVSVVTPDGTVGIRGTTFLVRVKGSRGAPRWPW